MVTVFQSSNRRKGRIEQTCLSKWKKLRWPKSDGIINAYTTLKKVFILQIGIQTQQIENVLKRISYF